MAGIRAKSVALSRHKEKRKMFVDVDVAKDINT
jgi:hypothetical protein